MKHLFGAAFALLAFIPAKAGVTIINLPQPTVLVAGDRAVFTVLASGTGVLSYQWKKDGTSIAGATSSALVIDPVALGDTGNYSVDVSDATPSTLASSAAVLTVNPPTGGDVDFTFGGASINREVRAVAMQSDGKLLIGGSFATVNNGVRGGIARLSSDGTTDYTFGNRLVGTGGNDPSVRAIALQSDGKILIGGGFDTVNGIARGRIARLNTDGTLDTTFGDGLVGADSTVTTVAVQIDGRVLIGGSFNNVNGTARGGFARLNADGSLDTTFGDGQAGAAGGDTGGTVFAIVVQGDGKVLVAGDFATVNGIPHNLIARLNSDGTIDPSFGNALAWAGGSTYGPSVRALGLQGDGKVLIGGDFNFFSLFTFTSSHYNFARLNSDGTLDTAFGSYLGGTIGAVFALTVQGDGKVLIGGGFTTVNGIARGGIARLNSTGTLDATFGNGLAGANNTVLALTLASDNKVLIGGGFSSVNGTARNHVARINRDGTLDAVFDSGQGGADGSVRALAIQNDGKVVIGGDFFVTLNGMASNHIARLNSNGTPDVTFGNGQADIGGEYIPAIRAVALQSDGKILIGGDFTTVNGTMHNHIARLNNNGSLDITFGGGLAGADGIIVAVAVQTDGKVLIGGSFTSVNGTTRRGIARLNSDGTLDSTFGFGQTGVLGFVNALEVQDDGKILIGGGFSSINGSLRNNIARLNSDGTVDHPFANGLSVGGIVHAVATQSDGKVLIGGDFTAINSIARGRFARLNSDGTLDTAFGNGLAGVNATVYSMVVQGDDKVLIGGSFTTANSAVRNRIARLNSNGTLDVTFGNDTAGASDQVNAVAMQGDGKAVIGGDFITVNGVARNYIARLAAPVTPAEITIEQPPGLDLVDGAAGIAFDTVAAGGSSAVKTFTIKNTSLETLTLGPFIKDGANAAEFTVNTTGTSTAVIPGASTTFSVVFAPAFSGMKSAALHIGNNDTDENPFDFELTARTFALPAEMLTPVNGSSLTTAATTFTWSAGEGVSSYVLWIGSTAGGCDLYAAHEGTNLSRTIALPTDGRTVYVKLWSLINGVYEGVSYAYATPRSVKARITSPANGSTLDSNSLGLAWDAGIAISQTALWVGTTVDGYNLYSGVETGGSRTVAVPANGANVYVTLWSLANGIWQSNRYVFKAQAPAKATLASPIDGSTLGSSTLNLTWIAGVGASKYAIWIGSSPGGYDLGAADAGTALSRSFTVPQDGGPIYVTLWSVINGAYQSNSYWFTTALPGSGNRPARITSPANASALSSATLNLVWDAGVGAASYALWVGSKPDGYDLYAGAEGTNTARTVNVPGDGRRIYVTLHSLIGGAYQSNSYYFTAPNLPDKGAAQITSPAIGSTLGSTSLPLTWTSATGASQYILWAGDAPSGYNRYAGAEGLNLNRTITALPADGSPVYATLYSLINGAYLPSTAWFTTANTGGGNKRARLTSPGNGSTLSGSQSFTWDSGTGVTGCALWIGSSPSSYDLLAAAVSPNSNRTVTLPTDGRKIYVTLYSLIGGAYQSNGWFFTAANTAPVKAAMTSPANGSVLAGSSVTFNWSAAPAATRYYLYVGRRPGGYDVYAGDEVTNLNKTITTMPTDGGPVYVTLWSLINGAYLNNEYIYQAALPP